MILGRRFDCFESLSGFWRRCSCGFGDFGLSEFYILDIVRAGPEVF